MRRKIFFVLVLLAVTVCSTALLKAEERPEVEVVFCLDTTGSMGGLIEGAKQKIWSIANQIVMGRPVPDLSIGLVGYRDRGDEYITQVFQLDDDLDAVYENLMSFKADGGGDTPEHVNKALHDAVHEMEWSGKSALKLVFLVGDCPPHMDYRDGYDYHRTCREAVRKDIIINTIQCGDFSETEKVWREIARLSEGSYASVPQEGGMRIIHTPMDAELASLSEKLEGTIVAYGTAEVFAESTERLEKVKEMAPAAAAERAGFKSVAAELSTYDLVNAVKNKRVNLEEIGNEELPEEMRTMSLEEKLDYLDAKEKERMELKARIAKLNRERSDYIAVLIKENLKGDSFDESVQEMIKEQASEVGIRY